MPKRKLSTETDSVLKKKDAKRQRFAANDKHLDNNKNPNSLPAGIILTDLKDRQWTLGRSIGVGGFGEIYLASESEQKSTTSTHRYVIKIEPHSNGPLFSEMHFYFRVGKKELIEDWMIRKQLDFLGMPKFIGSGSYEHNRVKYRFMIMDRFGSDLQKLLEKNGGIFPIKTVYTLGIKILHVLEYVHSHGYIHADVKAANLTSGFGDKTKNEVYLVDFGLACKYTSNGVHKDFNEDLRKAHDGTLEYTSRDAHIGAHSRRGDLEVLGYNMLQWICGSLPWEDYLKDPEAVCNAKKRYMKDIPSLMTTCFRYTKPPRGILEYLMYVASLEFEDEPDYDFCYGILKSAITACGFTYDGELVYKAPKGPSLISQKRLNKHIDVLTPKQLRIQPTLLSLTSGSATSISTPCKKIRRVASATPRLQSKPFTVPPITEYISTINNPTPAMLLVINRKLEQQQAEMAKTETNSICKNSNGIEKIIPDKMTPHVNNHISSDSYSSATNGHGALSSGYKFRQGKMPVIEKKKLFVENERVEDSPPLVKKSLKKLTNKNKGFLSSPIARRTRLLQKTRDKGAIYGIRGLNVKVSSW